MDNAFIMCWKQMNNSSNINLYLLAQTETPNNMLHTLLDGRKIYHTKW